MRCATIVSILLTGEVDGKVLYRGAAISVEEPRTPVLTQGLIGDAAELEAASLAWLEAVAAALATPEEHVLAGDHNLGGHELALLDFDPAVADRLRQIGHLIEIPDSPDVRTALAISGSSAQARIHPFPGDADYFERVHLSAPDRSIARHRFANLVRENALATANTPALRLVEVHFGRLPSGAGGALRWTPAELRSGVARRQLGSGETVSATWDAAAADPALVKLDWHLRDPALGGPIKVCKVIDGTWEVPDGRVESLDGLIDADFQQVYLAADDAALAARLASHAAPDLGRALYVAFMEQEIVKYLRRQPIEYVKVAKRLYNRCRLTGHYQEAVWLRELFDDEPAELVQVRAQIQLLRDEGPEAAVAARLHGALDAFARALAPDDPGIVTIRECRDLLLDCLADDGVPRALALLEAATTEAAGRIFERKLRTHPAVASLLAEIEAKVDGGVREAAP